MPSSGSLLPSDPKLSSTTDLATAQEMGIAKQPFCEKCGATTVVVLFDHGFWGTTGQKRTFFGLICSEWIADITRESGKGHFGVYSLGDADPDRVDQTLVFPYDNRFR